MASFGRALLRLVAAVAATVAVIALLVANPLTRPPSIAAKTGGALAGLQEFGADLIVRQATAGIEDQAPRPLPSDDEERLRSVVADAFATEWIDETVRSVASGMEAWIAGHDRPPVAIDLTGPKDRISEHPDALLLATLLSDTEAPAVDVDEGMAVIVVNQFLADVPDEVRLDDADWWPQLTTRLADVRASTHRIGLFALIVALVATTAGVVSTPHPRRSAAATWVGWLLLWVAVPLLLGTWAMPTMADAVPLPNLPALIVGVVTGVWGVARVVGWIALVAAFAAWGASHALRSMGTDRDRRPASIDDRIPEPV